MVAWKTEPEYQEIPQPEPGPGQVLIRVGAAGLCHSDLHVIHEFDAGVFNAELPFTLGHESAGWVEALGPGTSGIEVGEAVAVYGPLGCGRCAHCQTGDENLCDRIAQLPGAGWGLGVDGGMAPYMVVDSVRQLAPLGDLDPVVAAPLTDAAVTPYRAIRRSLDRLVPGSVAVVIGIGGLGHLAVQILSALSPATIVAVDAKPEALKFAQSLGAHHTVEAGADAASAINELTKGLGVDATFDLVGNDATLALAFAIAPERLADHARRRRRRCRGVLVLGDEGGSRAVDVELGKHQRLAGRDRPRPYRPDRAEGDHVRLRQDPRGVSRTRERDTRGAGRHRSLRRTGREPD